jgi:hypothetical protein
MALRTRPLTPAAFPRAATFPIALAVVLLALALLGPASALARGGGGGGGDRPEVRVAGVCGRGASAKLKLKTDDGAIEAEFEVHGRSGARWRVVFVQESRVAWRGRARTSSARRSFSIERRLSDFPGADQVMARAVGPRGLTCTATATLPG